MAQAAAALRLSTNISDQMAEARGMAKASARKPAKSRAIGKTKPEARSKSKPKRPGRPAPALKMRRSKTLATAQSETARGADDVTTEIVDASSPPKRGADGKFLAVASRQPKAKATPLRIVQKIYQTLDGELTKLEKQKGLESQDRERASRALSQIVSSFGKATMVHKEISTASPRGAKKADTEALRHADVMRREIADRLERLQRERGSRKRDRAADAG